MTVSFSDESTGSPTAWAWTFGDGGTSTQQNPSHTYTTAGTYTVGLPASNADGDDPLEQTDYITVTDPVPSTPEGFILSKKADFSSDDRTFSTGDTLYMKIWSDPVDGGNLKKAEWELQDANRVKEKQNLTYNPVENTFTAEYNLADLPSDETAWQWKGKMEDDRGVKYEVKDISIEVLEATAIFTVMGDGRILDNDSGLFWLWNAGCSELAGVDSDGEANREEANTAAAALSHGTCGLEDESTPGAWRLPTKEELEALVDRRYSDPALSNTAGDGRWEEGDAFSEVQSDVYWSSSVDAGAEVATLPRAWTVDMYHGFWSLEKQKASNYVWPVRLAGGGIPAEEAPCRSLTLQGRPLPGRCR